MDDDQLIIKEQFKHHPKMKKDIFKKPFLLNEMGNLHFITKRRNSFCQFNTRFSKICNMRKLQKRNITQINSYDKFQINKIINRFDHSSNSKNDIKLFNNDPISYNSNELHKNNFKSIDNYQKEIIPKILRYKRNSLGFY